MTSEWYELKGWFDTEYTKKEQKYRRLHTLFQLQLDLSDEAKNAYSNLLELYNEAEIKRKRIQELENE